MNLIGLDIGTTSICGVLYSRKEPRTLNVAVRENSFIASSSGEYQQDPNVILTKVKSILDELIELSVDKIDGISLSTQMHGILYVNKEGQAVTPFYTWQNQRGLAYVGDQKLESLLTEMFGYPVYTGYGIVTHYSLMKEMNIPSSAISFCSIGDYVCTRLAGGKIPATDITIGNSMGICDLSTGKKSDSLSVLGSECTEYIPEIVSSTRHLGDYRGIPVIQALGDNQASFLGSVREKDNSLLLNYGTAGQISFYRNTFETFPGFECRPLGNEGYIHAAFSLCGGNSYKLLARFFEIAVSEFTNGTSVNSMKVMDEMTLDFSEVGIECMPFFLGQRGNKDENAYFRNLTEANFTPRNMVKALIQGMVNELYQYYSDLPDDVKNKILHLVGAGNGIRKNKHLIQAVELTYGKHLTILSQSEESCIGAIINAGKGIGVYSSYSDGALEIVRY